MKNLIVCIALLLAPSSGIIADDAAKTTVESSKPNPLQHGDWFVPARMNYGTWAQRVEEDFPDGDIDGRLAKMAGIGMRDYFFYISNEKDFCEKLFAAAKKHNVRLWVRTFGQAGYSEEEAKEHPERLFQMDWTKKQRIACLSWPENQVKWIDWMEPVLRDDREHLYGVNLDFIRYPDDSPCNCAACRALYEKWLGRKEVSEEDLENDKDLARKYAAMRNSVVGGMVKKVRAMCDRLGLKLSAAVFTDLNHARMLGQDWPLWAREGWLDVVCPMSYTSDRSQHQRWLGEHLSAMGNEAELWESVACEWDQGKNTPAEVLAQSLNVLRSGARGLASYNMAAFDDEDWRLQAALQKECGWKVAVRDRELHVEGPPLAWMKLPPWKVSRCVGSGVHQDVQKEIDGVVVRGEHVWMQVACDFSPAAPGQLVKVQVEVHNATPKDAEIRFRARLPEGWRIESPAESLHLPAGEDQSVAVAVRVPKTIQQGRYWIDIMAEDAKSDRPVLRALETVVKEVGGVRFTVLPLTATRFTSSPTWLPVDIVQNPDQ